MCAVVRAPSVVIIASPYEGELLGRSLAETGVRVLRADGGEGGHALISTELPIAVVLGTSLFGADPASLVAAARARNRDVAVFLLAETDDPVAAALRPRVTDVLRRPADFEALAQRIEGLAVDEEQDDDLAIEIIEPMNTPPPIPRTVTQPVVPDNLVRPHRTEIIGSREQAPMPMPDDLLRADDALGALVGIGFDEVVAPMRAFEGRSTIARAINRELSQAERRLFPDHAVTPVPFTDSLDYDDALGDIDLDSLGIDTIPGLRENGRRHSEPAPREVREFAPRPTEAPSRPIQEEGSLEVSRAEGDKVVYFDNGDPVGARSTLRHDHLAELLFREGKLTREQVAKLRAHDSEGVAVNDTSAQGLARPVALRLVEEGALKEGEVFAAARRHLEEIWFSLFSLQTGTYRLAPTLPSADDRVRASTTTWALIVEGVRRKYGLERLMSRLGDRAMILSPTTLFGRASEGAALTIEERRVVVLFDGQRTLADVRTTLGRAVTESMILGVAWSFVVLGALERPTANGGGEDLRWTSTVVTADPGVERRTAPRPIDGTKQIADRGVERERILAKRAQILDADYFTILGVARDATEHELRRAHARQRADFDVAQFDSEVARELEDALGEIAEVLDEALRVLSVPAIRERYASNLTQES